MRRWMMPALLLALAQPAAGDEGLAAGRLVFTQQAQPSCGLCHTLNDAGSTGQIGPDLDTLRPTAEQVRQAVSGGVGVMPAFGDSLSAEQIAAVAHYVATVAGQ
ncbi:sulfide dehydrogenase [Zobellella endophytica]|uniref:Sulfide dehydrogenase n=1 Tax=Zobellella endophytica TaxID=2116700 RepID=A0A2P7R1H1_9GAMM|nr:cytochrome c [Zobellella endophytica]PSJ44071.1 sulfide dehydrogenase [Zobellella endophytica]